MYLKSIEMQGFKSFADRVVLEFQDGITGIVGPNGSGKSNVADAVRWVLGEQSAKQLRGTRMEDIIFAGTQLRKKLGFAYVAMTFDNSDHKLSTPYDEVKVARRVYRSGESEYLLNASVCRLRDVQELFLDTGIGKEGYSIIGQGQIEKILSGRPEDRRELFDEAAGIAKFKKRKQDALRNLEEEQKNLVRIKDIIAEIEVQIEPLKKQAKKAQEFLQYREELKTQEISQFLLESGQVQKSILELDEKLKTAKEDYAAAEKDFAAQKASYEELLKTEQEQKTEWANHQQTLLKARVDREKHEGNGNVLREKLHAAEERRQQNTQRLQEILQQSRAREKERVEHITAIEKLREGSEDIFRENQEMAGKVSGLSAQISRLEEVSEEKKDQIFEIKSSRLSLQAEINRYKTMLDQNTIKKAEYQKQLLVKKGKEEAVKKELKENEEKYLSAIEQEKKCLERKAKETKEYQQQKKEAEELRTLIEERQMAFHRESSRLESLRSITERYDGFGNSIKRVMEQKHSGVLGVVSDVIRVKRRYETALEAALGGSIQNVVTDTEETAKQMIAFLKQHQYGRATFLPLTGLSVNEHINRDVLSEQGVIGYGNTLVETEARFGRLADFLLGRTLVVDTIDHAILIARKYRQSVRMVTLEGELFSVGGAMSGGRYKSAGNLLGRRREIEELEKKTGNLSRELSEYKNKLESLIQSNGKRSGRFEDMERMLQELSLQKNTMELKNQQLLDRQNEIENDFADYQKEEHTLESQSGGLKQAVADLEKDIQETEQQEAECQKESEQMAVQLKQMRADLEQYSKQAEQFRMEHAAVLQKISFEEEHMKRIDKEQQGFEQEKKRLESDSESISASEEELKEQIRLEQDLAGKEEEQIKKQEAFGKVLQQKQKETSVQLKEAVIRREEMQEQLTSLDRECYRLESQKRADKAKLDEMSEYIWKEYQLTYYQAKDKIEWPTETLPVIKKRVEALQQKKKALGDVNVNAIEDYRQVSGRYDLMKGQHDDVVAAEEALLKIIDDLDHQMREQFEEKFQEIRVQFDQVFRELFGGGQGTLELTDKDDVLTAGIRIHAQPPGKKLQNMMQLSGGEKSLTAIALLFAIQNLKPSPFCLLDEIEAALDDANVKRFAKYLHKLTKDTQFLVITHRRGTMAAADVLYGITMQEKGVSTLVSVSLVEADLK